MASWGTIGAELGRGQDASLGGFLGSLGRPHGGLLAVFVQPPRASWGPLGNLSGSLGGVFWASGALLGACWRSRGQSFGEGFDMSVRIPPFGALLGASGGILGGLLGSLGALLGRLGAVLGASWADLGRSWRPHGPS